MSTQIVPQDSAVVVVSQRVTQAVKHGDPPLDGTRRHRLENLQIVPEVLRLLAKLVEVVDGTFSLHPSQGLPTLAINSLQTGAKNRPPVVAEGPSPCTPS